MKMAETMAHLARHDFLTDLPNRVLVNERLARAIAVAGRNGRKAAVLFLDLDRFKLVNDSLGHAMGDKLLVSVKTRASPSPHGDRLIAWRPVEPKNRGPSKNKVYM